MTRSSIPNAGFTRSRNRLDTEGYGGVPFEQTHPFIAGLIGGGVIFGLSLWAMPPLHSGPRCDPSGAQPQAASCQHRIAIAGER